MPLRARVVLRPNVATPSSTSPNAAAATPGSIQIFCANFSFESMPAVRSVAENGDGFDVRRQRRAHRDIPDGVGMLTDERDDVGIRRLGGGAVRPARPH